MKYRVLGPVDVVGHDRRAVVRSDRQRTILAALLVHLGERVPFELLVHILWGARPPPGARGTLHAHTSRLRRTLTREGETQPLVTRSGGYVLELGPDDLDAASFERLLGDARGALAGDPGRAVALLDEALAVWCGPAYAEFVDEDFARAEAARLDELRLLAAEDRVDACLAMGRHTEVIAGLEATVARHPLRERPCGQLMVARYRDGRTAEALHAYRCLRARLVEELGLDPSVRLRRLQADILAQADWLATPGARQVGPARTRPAPLSSFIGRQDALASLPALLDRARVVTLTGAGGVGKTRLATELVALVADRYPGGVHRVDLAPIHDPDAVTVALANALGVTRQGGEPLFERLVVALRLRQALLLVDNCEHLLAAVADVVERLGGECPRLSVLATSRERLAVAGEHVWLVAPLAVPAATSSRTELARVPSVQLFRDRASAVDPTFDLDEHGPAVARVCRRLDGVPLAIELAAARAGALLPAELADRLDDRFRLLTTGPRTEGGRHRTLRATVQWSYDLLEPTEALLFARLSVFAGGFDLAVAEDVCGPDVAGLVATLVDKSMVVSEPLAGTSRFRLLETLREYAGERLAERNEAESAARRHAEYFVALAERADRDIRGRDEERAVAALDRELDNLRAAHLWMLREADADLALRLSSALHEFAVHRLRDEVLGWALAAAELPAAAGHPLRAAALASAARGATHRGELDRARELAVRALAAAIGPAARIKPLDALGIVAFDWGRPSEARRHCEDAAALARAHGDRYRAQWNETMAAVAATHARDPAVPELVERVHRGAVALANPSLLACAYCLRGEALVQAGDPDRSIEPLDRAITLAEPVRNRFVRGIALMAVATARGRSADPGSALRPFREIFDHRSRAGATTQQRTSVRNLVDPLVRLGVDEPAAVLLGAVKAAPPGPARFGSRVERLTRAEEALRARTGDERFDSAAERGSAMADDEVVRFALTTLDGLLAARGGATGAPPGSG